MQGIKNIYLHLHELHVHFIPCQFLDISLLKCFAVDVFFMLSGIWFHRWLARKAKPFKPYL